MKPGSYRKLVEELSDIATIIDAEGTIKYVSPAVRDTLGYDPEELIGEEGFPYQHPEDREAVADAIETLQANPDETQVIETRFRRADGTWCWIEATMQNRLEDPDIEGILVDSRDISARKRQERRFQALSQEYKTLLETVEDGIFFISVDSVGTGYEFRFERLNRAYEEQTGITTGDVRGKTPIAVFGEDVGAELQANYARCARAREPISYQEEVPVETDARFWQTSLAPVVADGEVPQIIGITRNVTERVERERTLRRHKRFLEESPVAIAVTDETGELTYQSSGSEQVVGHPPGDLLGESAFAHIHPDDRGAVVDRFSELVGDPGASQTAEYRFKDGDANWRWIRSAATNYLEEPAIAGILIASVDISDRKAFEQRLERQRDTLEVINQALRHDIRNDLQLVLGHAETLDHRLDEERESVEGLLESVRQAIDVTDSARDVAKMTLGTDSELERVDLRNVLSDVVADARESYEDANIRIDGSIPPVEVHGDEMIRSVFRNLATNAVQHNDKQVPDVSVSVTAGEDHVDIYVADNGPGISDQRKAAIFEEGTRGRTSSGTGLGLYLVQSLVDRYGGSVWVEDRDPEGAVFGVQLPTVGPSKDE